MSFFNESQMKLQNVVFLTLDTAGVFAGPVKHGGKLHCLIEVSVFPLPMGRTPLNV